MYNLGTIDRDATSVYLRGEVVEAWRVMSWFIEHQRRASGNRRVYAQWERMKDDLLRRVA